MKQNKYNIGNKANYKHGMVGTPVYISWANMINRCSNINNPDYKYYGGRGIKVCKKWSDFPNFLNDMGHPKLHETLDRIDNDKGYSPSNCRWATRKIQNNNTRVTKKLTFNGVTKSIREWADELNIKHNTLHARLYLGWSVEKTLTKPVRRLT